MSLQELTKTDFDKIYKIMDQSFPVDEHRPYEEQKALFDLSYYHVYGMIDEKTKLLKGFIAVWDFEGIAFIEHFAVSQKFRNEGIGSLLLKNVLSYLNKRVCLEVEPPEDDLKKRRIGFYRRNGFFLNQYSYMQPPLSKGQKSLPLLIMTTKEALSEDEFSLIKDLLYEKVYQVK